MRFNPAWSSVKFTKLQLDTLARVRALQGTALAAVNSAALARRQGWSDDEAEEHLGEFAALGAVSSADDGYKVTPLGRDALLHRSQYMLRESRLPAPRSPARPVTADETSGRDRRRDVVIHDDRTAALAALMALDPAFTGRAS